MNCNGYLDVEFASYLVIDNSMQVKQYTNLNSIPLTIAVNTENLKFYKYEEVYKLPESVPIPNPCFPNDPTKAIIVDEVTLNTVKADGYIGYHVGADVHKHSSNVIVPNQTAPLNPDAVSTYATTGSRSFVSDLDLLIQDNPDDPIPSIGVTVKDLEVSAYGVNDNGEHYYLLTGYFRIQPII
ncbi:MAG: hypothetical protein ACRCXA_03080 [Peptostreptococcaceae bacterium]